MNKAALNNLDGFSGTQQYHKLNPFGPFYLTDGSLYLAQNADCFWMMNEIAGAQVTPAIKKNPRLQEIQFWTLEKTGDKSATLCCYPDHGEPAAYEKKIEFTDFPFDVLPNPRVWVATSSLDGVTPCKVAMVPSEY